MAFLKVKNRAVSTLASGISDSDLSLTVATGEGALFPTTGDFHLSLDTEALREIVKCTSRSSDVLTIVRAQEGTGAAAHTAGKAVKLMITAGVVENVQTELTNHNAAVLSHLVHNNNNYFLGYGNETIVDPVTAGLIKIPTMTAIADPASGLDVSDWYGASGAYRQSDADSDATHIEDDDANFPASIMNTLVKWASDAAGTTNTGIGYIHSATDADTLLIAKFTGADFAASYYYWIKHSEWVVPVTGIYYVKAAVLFLPSEADKRFEVRVFYYSGTSAPVQLVQGVSSSGLADYEFPAIGCLASLTADDHLYAAGQHGGTSGTPNIYTSNGAHLPLQAFLLKQTA